MSDAQLGAELRNDVRIHIDREPYRSPNPTTGAALYALGHVADGKELFREATGDHEDEPVPNDSNEIHLKEDEHFYSEKEITIIVNGRPKIWTENKISYGQLVQIANLPLPTGRNPGFTITYHDGPRDHPDGTLTPGHSVRIKKGMVFNVTPTNQS